MDQPRIDIIKNVLYSDSLFSCILEKKLFILILQKILISFTTVLTLLFFLLLQKDFYIAQEHIGAFCLFLLQKDFGTFRVLFFELFFNFFNNSYLSFLYTGKKLIFFIRIFFVRTFFIRTFFIRSFFIRIFSIRIRRNFCITNNILSNLFLKQHIYILPKTLRDNSFYLF